MYDKDKIEDSLEFVKKIYLYEKCPPDKVTDMMTMQNVSRSKIDEIEGINKKESDKEKNYKESIGREEISDEKQEKLWFSLTDFVYVIACIVISVLISYGITHFVAHHTKVEGSSMNDNLYDGDYLIIEKLSYYFGDPDRFDVIVFSYSEDVYYIKRVIGLPGEKVQIVDGKVYINDELLEEDIYGKDLIIEPGIASEPVIIGENEVFVLGDNRNSSIDSRRATVGKVSKDKIEGRAVLRVWPFSSFGAVR